MKAKFNLMSSDSSEQEYNDEVLEFEKESLKHKRFLDISDPHSQNYYKQLYKTLINYIMKVIRIKFFNEKMFLKVLDSNIELVEIKSI